MKRSLLSASFRLTSKGGSRNIGSGIQFMHFPVQSLMRISSGLI